MHRYEDSLKRVSAAMKRINTRNSIARFNLLRLAGRILAPNYRFKWPQMEWWDEPGFNHFLVKFNEIAGLNTDRRWMLYQLMRLAKNVPGDTAECGVYAGAGSYIMCKVNQEDSGTNRLHHIFDSFEGLSSPSELDGKHWREGDLSCSHNTVVDNLLEFPNVKIHKGWIPQGFAEVERDLFCFVHIDVDLYQPTRDSIEFFYPRVNAGGLILCDDYGFTSCPGATKAIDEFFQDKKEKMISLSEGGGFVIKGIETASRSAFLPEGNRNATT